MPSMAWCGPTLAPPLRCPSTSPEFSDLSYPSLSLLTAVPSAYTLLLAESPLCIFLGLGFSLFTKLTSGSLTRFVCLVLGTSPALTRLSDLFLCHDFRQSPSRAIYFYF